MDRRKAEQIRKRVLQVLSDEFPELKVSFKGGSYSDSYYNMKIEFAETASTGDALTAEYTALLKFHSYYGVSDEVIANGFQHPRLGKCEVIGIKTKNTKYPVIVKAADGKRYKFSERDIQFYAGN
jgi:hypothetical protein